MFSFFVDYFVNGDIDDGENKVKDLELIKLQVDPLRIYSLFQNLISIGPKILYSLSYSTLRK